MTASDADVSGFVETRDITKADVNEMTDEKELAELYRWLEEKALYNGEFIKAFNLADVMDEDWYERMAGALAYSQIKLKWVERRMLELGFDPPYSPVDPRGRAIRNLEDANRKLKLRVTELERRLGIEPTVRERSRRTSQ